MLLYYVMGGILALGIQKWNVRLWLSYRLSWKTKIILTGGRNGNPIQYLLLEKFQGQRCLAGCNPWESQKVWHTWVTKHACMHEDIFTKKFDYKWKLFTLWVLQTDIEFRNMNKRLKYVLMILWLRNLKRSIWAK